MNSSKTSRKFKGKLKENIFEKVFTQQVKKDIFLMNILNINLSKDVVHNFFLILYLKNNSMALYKKLTNTGLYILKYFCIMFPKVLCGMVSQKCN